MAMPTTSTACHAQSSAISWRSVTNSSTAPNDGTGLLAKPIIRRYGGDGAIIMDGRLLADDIQHVIRHRIRHLQSTKQMIPGLAVVLVGDSHPDSLRYVRRKQEAAESCGIATWLYHVPDATSEAAVLALIDKLNHDPNVHGILVQLPLPKHMRSVNVFESVVPHKDVDGFHPFNMGRLALNQVGVGGERVTARATADLHDWDVYAPDCNIACTPRACLALLDHYDIPVHGKKAVVLGRSHIVGLPVSLLLQHRNATVTTCHIETPLPITIASCQQADIIISAVGRAGFVRQEWVKPGAAVLDVGINFVPASKQTSHLSKATAERTMTTTSAAALVDSTAQSSAPIMSSSTVIHGRHGTTWRTIGDIRSSKDDAQRSVRLTGDADYDNVARVAGHITPVPGGIGPMTVAMLLDNTVRNAYRLTGLPLVTPTLL